jgi:hypothetical protein
MKKELVKYNPLKAGYQKAKVNVKNIAKRIPGEYKFLGKVGKQLGKVGKFAVKNPISAAAIGIGAYALGAKSRRYAKAPKVGEGRDLNTRLIRRGI